MTRPSINSTGSYGGSPEVDTLLLALADKHRRHVLRHFQTSEQRITSLEDLSNAIVERDGVPEDREQITIDLHHRHLPKLADTELVEYDTRRRIVRYRDHQLVKRILHLLTDTEAVGKMELMTCCSCDRLIQAIESEGTFEPCISECPECGGTSFNHSGTGEIIDIQSPNQESHCK